MRATPAESAAATDPPAGARPLTPRTRRMALRVTLMTLAGALLLAALALFAYALAAARVPQHRAALENLLRAEAGLDVRFNDLVLHWGWYGPEVVFRGVALGEPGEPRSLLRASRLVVGVDLWHMLRSGELQIGRITLIDPDIDLTHAPLGRAARGAGASTGAPLSPMRLLARWRGVRIDVQGGTLRAALSGAPLAVGIRSIQLRRSGAQWSAEALLTLPPALGATAEVSLRGVAALPEELSGTLSIKGQRLELAGWRALLGATPGAELLPSAGSGNVSASLVLAHGALARADGSVQAEELKWPAAETFAAGFTLERLHADWQLARTAAGWHLAAQPLELEAGEDARAALTLDAASDAAWVRGRIQQAPVEVLAGLARSLNPGLVLAAPVLGGTVREASFDWSSARAPAQRLRTAAELDDLSIAAAGSPVRLAGLAAHVRSDGHDLSAELHSDHARVTLADDPEFELAPVTLSARLELDDNARGWRLSTRDLEIRATDAQLRVSATLMGDAAPGRARLEAHATLSDARVELVRKLLGTQALAALGGAGELIAGRIEHAELTASGFPDEPLPWSGAHRAFTGSVVLRAARLAGSASRPDLTGLEARIDWRGTRVAVRLSEGTSGTLKVVRASGEWDARDASLVRLSGRLSGDAEEALAWLTRHPQVGSFAPALEGIELRGAAALDFSVQRAYAASRSAAAPRFTTRVTALLDGAQLHAVTGLPSIEALRGTLAFVDGRLQRSTVTGQWLGGPIALTVSERGEHGAPALAISGRGLLDVHQALIATGAHGAEGELQGNAEWSADLRLLAAAPGRPASLRVRADSSLIGVTSRLPEPFAKPAGATFALHAELSGTQDAGELRVALGERLRGLIALERRGELWQIERGAVRFGASVPALPEVPVVRIEGNLSRLDLAAYAALWRALARNSAWPALRVELNTTELLAAGRSYPNVRLTAESGAGSDVLRLESPQLAGVVRLPAMVDAAHPASVRLERLDLPELAAAPAAAALLGALSSNAQLAIDDLRWQGRSLGSLSANLAAHADAIELSEVTLAGAGDEAHGALRCQALCRATFSLESADAAATLVRLGLPSDLAAARTRVSGALEWPAFTAPAWASITGLLHMELGEGVARSTRAATPEDSPFGLFAVPGLIAGLGLPELRFTRLTADFALGDGQAFTSDLHLDGDTEILMRGRIGLVAHDYDAQVWVLKGEQRLPAAVRSLVPAPKVAALWLSLRELFTGAGHGRAALRLRGTWNDPMVTEP
ncbi:MAG: YhdP family protein [Steroidobacteraceae bacterium]